MCFNETCPTEFVTAFTTALAETYRQGPMSYLTGPDTTDRVPDPLPVITPLLARGWRIDHPHWDAFAVQSPDELATLQYATGGLDPEAELTTRATRWELWADPPDFPYWYATASTNTPTVLLKAVTPTAPASPTGALAQAGADATPWMLAGAGFLVVGGAGTVVAARRRMASNRSPQDTADH
ncbi:hypothetical protein EASAB2608_01042 [Streptomyces sp. EAS-AB2608]|uniref:DUF317 domain-containing protein n=1 Tax=Streptomyces sp. EAS-AB2608 TaxID=2779671 RepID=UPI001BF0E89E|nr:DUF317 domain-containing protein [Streptomyces sp. EAS-AB2608]BCM65708.1 hypothetical protein EASAB2608_01042 [Streptomyces sp. EAS-AB2608]